MNEIVSKNMLNPIVKLLNVRLKDQIEVTA